MVAAPIADEMLHRCYPHAVIGKVVSVERRSRRSYGGLVIADVAVKLAIVAIRKGPLRPDTLVTVHGDTILANDDGLDGPSSTIPDSLDTGRRVRVSLEDRGGRLTVPHWSAFIVGSLPAATR